ANLPCYEAIGVGGAAGFLGGVTNAAEGAPKLGVAQGRTNACSAEGAAFAAKGGTRRRRHQCARRRAGRRRAVGGGRRGRERDDTVHTRIDRTFYRVRVAGNGASAFGVSFGYRKSEFRLSRHEAACVHGAS